METGKFDFAMIAHLACKALEKNNSSNKKFASQFKHLLVDEFQDISPLRASLLKNLRTYSDFNFFCVGDDWQSIYRFAGGEIGIMVFENEFEKYFGKRVKKNLQ